MRPERRVVGFAKGLFFTSASFGVLIRAQNRFHASGAITGLMLRSINGIQRDEGVCLNPLPAPTSSTLLLVLKNRAPMMSPYGSSSTTRTAMLCTLSSGAHTTGMMAEPSMRIGGAPLFAGLAACRDPLPFVLSFWLTPPHLRSVQ